MGADSLIGWTDDTFNPWVGCSKVSAGCRGCYAEVSTPARTARARGLELWGPPATTARQRLSAEYWKQPLTWNRAASASGKPRAVFCGSLCDIAEDHPSLDPWRADLWRLVEATPWLTWLLLTKRPERLATVLPPAWLASPRHNVWLGTTTEDQSAADDRLPALLSVPAVLHFASVEPLLGAVDLRGYVPDVTGRDHVEASAAMVGRGRYPLAGASARLGWVIVGGESGPRRRECDIGALVTVAGVALGRGVPVYVKQDSAPRSGAQGRIPDDVWALKQRPALHFPQGVQSVCEVRP